MAEWNQAALVALQGSLKTNVKMIQLYDLLERPAGGFMDRAEVLSVNAKTGDMEQMGEIINILRGKEDAAFNIFCDLLQRSNYGVWAQELASAAEGLKTEQGKFTVFNSICEYIAEYTMWICMDVSVQTYIIMHKNIQNATLFYAVQ